MRAPQFGEQFAVQAGEAAVAHDEDVIAVAHCAGELTHQRIHIGAEMAARAKRARHGAHVPAQIRRRVKPHLIGIPAIRRVPRSESLETKAPPQAWS